MWTYGVTEFLRTLQLIFLEPFLKQVLPILCENRTSEFERFVAIQCPFIKENTKVLENGRELARLYRDMLETLNGIRCPKNTLSLDSYHKIDRYTWGEFAATLAASP
jgi:hypothetical protein